MKILLCLVFFTSGTLYAQKEANNWIFNNFQLNFNTPQVSVEPNTVTNSSSLGFTSISDSLGNLLLYTNSFSLWDHNYQLIKNGDSLLPSGYHTYVQESIIIPKPGSHSVYYVFTDDPDNNFSWSGLYYAVVDLSLNGGQGEVVQKRIKLLDATTDKIAATYHQNHRDIWLIVHKKNTNNYYTYHITPDGVSADPVINGIGRTMSGDGQLKISPDSKTAAVSMDESQSWGVDLFDFDNVTGTFSNLRSFWVEGLDYNICNGMEYSPDGKKIYLSGYDYLPYIYQFDITLPTGPAIASSAKRVLTTSVTDFFQLQLGPDHKIYMTKGGGQVSDTYYLGVIEQPNISGDSCQAVENALYLNGGNVSTATTPNFLHEYFYKPTDFIIRHACLADSILFILSFVPGIDSVSWSFGDGATSRLLHPKHKYPAAGEYQVISVAWYAGVSDTTSHTVTIHPSPVITLGSDTAVCRGYQLKMTNPDYRYVWNNGSTGNLLIPVSSGTYWVNATNQFNCSVSDTIRLVVYPLPWFSLGNDTTVCSNSGFMLSPDWHDPGYRYAWSNGSTSQSIQVGTEGLYWLTLTNTVGCQYTDSVNVHVRPAPDINLGRDTTLSCGAQLTLDPGYYGYPTTYTWDDHSKDRTRLIRGSDLPKGKTLFFVTVTLPDHCIVSDSIVLTGTGPEICSRQDAIVYPNPNDGIFFIGLPELSDMRVELYSLTGPLLQAREFHGSNLYQIDYTAYPKGVYIIKFSYGLIYTKTEKLVII